MAHRILVRSDPTGGLKNYSMKRKRTAQSAPARRSLDEGGFFNLRASIAILFCVLVGCSVLSATLLGFFSPQASLKVSERTLSFADRVTYQRAIEDVYWRHRIWPGADPKPPLGSVMSQAQIENKVADYLSKSQALEDYWQRPVTAEQLQAEINRMAANTKQPEVLCELFEALGNDPFVIAECLAKPITAERLLVRLDANERIGGESKQSGLTHAETKTRVTNAAASRRTYMLPVIGSPLAGCTEDTWTPTSTTNAPNARAGHTAVWTGIEMIVWGGGATGPTYLNTGGRYNPSTDSWTATSTTNAPDARSGHTAAWTGSEMIVWGGYNGSSFLNTGGRYNPGTGSWTATSTTNAPVGRQDCTAVWTGSEIIVWGGLAGAYLNTGGRYNPTMNSWTATSITNAPNGRYEHTAIWTGSEMIVWGGFIGGFAQNDGGRYNPGTDSWTATSTANAPSFRGEHTAVWTNGEMIIWGGWDDLFFLNTGGRYEPGTDTWTATSTTDVPAARLMHTAVWNGREMIVWGGWDGPNVFNTGGRYSPGTDSWTATSTTNAPTARYADATVWTGSEMIVWGGFNGSYFNTGGRYCAQSGSPTPTPTPTATATPRATPTSRVRPTPAPRP
jgi:N-acetylneuraminic acid mutarotase